MNLEQARAAALEQVRATRAPVSVQVEDGRVVRATVGRSSYIVETMPRRPLLRSYTEESRPWIAEHVETFPLDYTPVRYVPHTYRSAWE